MLIFDPSILYITNNFNILDSLAEYQFVSQITNIHPGIDLSTNWMLIGLKSVSFSQGMPQYF